MRVAAPPLNNLRATRIFPSPLPTGTPNFTVSPGLSPAHGFTVAIQSAGTTPVAKSGSDSAALTERANVSLVLLRSDSAALTDSAQASLLVSEQAEDRCLRKLFDHL